jgi:hypothetical protein
MECLEFAREDGAQRGSSSRANGSIISSSICSVWLAASGYGRRRARVKYAAGEGAARPVLDACATMSARPMAAAAPSLAVDDCR